MKPTDQAWTKLAHSAARAPDDAAELPLGFATRVVANWKAQAGEALINTMESLTWRGLAVAMVILVGTAALGYDALSGFIKGDTSVTEDMVPSLSSLIP